MYVRVMDGSDVQAAVRTLRAAFDEAAADRLDLLTADQLFAVLDDVHALACRLPALRHRLVARLQVETSPGDLGARSWREALRVRYRLSGGAANRWLTQAEAFGPRGP